MLKFSQDYRVGLRNDFVALMDYVQQACLHHTYSTPGGMEYYEQAGLVWVLTHWHVELDELPAPADVINVSTWPVIFKSYFGERGFELRQGEKSLLRANSNWMLINRNSLKPTRADAQLAQKYGEPQSFLMTKDFSMPKAADFEFFGRHEYIATRRDIDNNQHVNNISYLQWISDVLPAGLIQRVPRILKVAYKKEVLCGDAVEILMHRRGDDEIFVIIEKGGKTTTEIYISWKKEKGGC